MVVRHSMVPNCKNIYKLNKVDMPNDLKEIKFYHYNN